LATLDFTTGPKQYCPECGGDGSPCWRCEGGGLVDAYDPFEPSIELRFYAIGGPGTPLAELRYRVAARHVPPEIELR